MQTLRRLWLCCIAAVLLVSCSVTKRHYRPGFYVSTSKTKEQAQPRHLHQKAEPVLMAGAENRITGFITNERVRQDPDSCDHVVMRDGKDIAAKVTLISNKEVKYYQCSMPTGPLFVVKKKDVLMIHYANGVNDVFPEENETEQPARTSVPVATVAVSGRPIMHEMAPIALILGITGLIVGLGSIPAIIIGTRVERDAMHHPGKFTGLGMARVGIVLGWIKMILVATLIFTLIFVFSI